jgi:integrase
MQRAGTIWSSGAIGEAAVQGSIRRKGEGRWQVRVFVGRDPATGKIRLREQTVRGTKREAQRVLAELVAAVDQKLIGASTSMTVSTLLDRWLGQCEDGFSPKTVLEVKGNIRRNIDPFIGDRRVEDLTTAQLDSYYQLLRKKGGVDGRGLAPATIHRVHGILRRALSQAVRWGIIRHNPAVDASPPRVPKPELSPPSPRQVAELFALAERTEPDFATFILLAASTGARRSELIALRWKHVDLDAGVAIIERGIVMSEDGPVEKDTKTHQVRRLTLDPTSLDRLREQHARRAELCALLGAELDERSFVFSDAPDGTAAWRPDSVTRTFRTLADRAGARDIRLHDLRHYVASRLLALGVDVRTVAGRLGHRDPSTTLNIYSHFIPEADQKAATALGQLFDQALSDVSSGG